MACLVNLPLKNPIDFLASSILCLEISHRGDGVSVLSRIIWMTGIPDEAMESQSHLRTEPRL